MKITPHTDEYDKIVRHGDLDEAPRVTITRYADKGKQLQPTHYRAVFHNRDGKWVCGHLQLGGLVVKKDDTVGKAANFRDYSEPLTEENTPQWVRDIVLYVRPSQEAPQVVTDSVTFQS